MDDRTEEIRNRVNAASPENWDYCEYFPLEKKLEIYSRGDTDNPIAWVDNDDTPNGKQNLEFIAHARTDIPYLLARISSLETELAARKKKIEKVYEAMKRNPELTDRAIFELVTTALCDDPK